MGIDLGHLTPIMWTRGAAASVAGRAQEIQRELGRTFLLENITYHFTVGCDLTEAQFITEIMENCDAGLLVDVSNVFSNSVNHSFDPFAMLEGIPLERAVQLHLAGGHWDGDVLEDAHDSAVSPEVWELADFVSERAPLRGALVERDDRFPSDFTELLAEVARARALVGRGLDRG
jgi:hypothetical protein